MTESVGYFGNEEKKATYSYNGLGHRIGQNITVTDPEKDVMNELTKQISYTVDLTKQYHNLLEMEENDVVKDFYWDTNVVSMDEAGIESYYIQDDLGSPMGIMDELGGLSDTYAFDEFGEGLNSDELDEHEKSLQPFGYTGYQMDEVSGLYYAQARRYDSINGRFISKDSDTYISWDDSNTLNLYSYCFGNPLKYLDPSGNVYIISWSYSKEDVEDFEAYCGTHLGYTCCDGNGKTTSDWTPEMWDLFNSQCMFARAADTRRRELIEAGVPEDEIVVVRIDGGEDFVSTWNDEWAEMENVEALEYYGHGTGGLPELYCGLGYDEKIFYNGTLSNLDWGDGANIVFDGCNTYDAYTSQQMANYFGVPVSGNVYSASFSTDSFYYSRVYDSWFGSSDVYLAPYLPYGMDDIDETELWDVFWLHALGAVIGRYRVPMSTAYPCGE